MTDDPFRHHPRLKSLITPRAQSMFADFRVEKAVEMMAQNGMETDWILPDSAREADRAKMLAGRTGHDLWVFAYGSLMWDPAMRFAEVRRAFAPGVERRFILYDTHGGRGTPDQPGAMAALDQGDGCNGLVFRIHADDLETETYSLWCRERMGPAYLSEFITAETDHGTVEALAFVADHEAEMIRGDLSYADQVRAVATGTGFLGSSYDYLANLAAHFAQMRIEDSGVSRLLADVDAYRATLNE